MRKFLSDGEKTLINVRKAVYSSTSYSMLMKAKFTEDNEVELIEKGFTFKNTTKEQLAKVTTQCLLVLSVFLKLNERASELPSEFQKNSYVLLQQRTYPDTRLHTLWRGALKVMDYKQGQYPLLDLTTNKEKDYHSNNSFRCFTERLFRIFYLIYCKSLRKSKTDLDIKV